VVVREIVGHKGGARNSGGDRWKDRKKTMVNVNNVNYKGSKGLCSFKRAEYAASQRMNRGLHMFRRRRTTVVRAIQVCISSTASSTCHLVMFCSFVNVCADEKTTDRVQMCAEQEALRVICSSFSRLSSHAA
jgi:hypothetical protein